MNKPGRSFYIFTGFFLLLVTFAGFAAKIYKGPGALLLNNSMAGLFYETFWCLLIFMFFYDIHPFKIGLGVFVLTSALEFLQLWHPPFLQVIRNTFIGAALLGNSFNWLDFPYYIAGCLAGILAIFFLKRTAK
ncbi:MAG: DUF2809 domain-containing protein [Bacteroidales bacterium]|nr:DUF2809 domain-containing protein [Bacteroidales bacterium]